MDTRERDTVVGILELMVRCEEAVGDYYLVCAETWPADRSFWLKLSDEETTHAVRLELLAVRVQTDATTVSVNRLFPRAALEAFLAGVARQSVRVLEGEVDRCAAIAFSRDLERSLIESQALQAIALSLPKWRNYLSEIAAETLEHEHRLQERFARGSQRDMIQGGLS